ncbi:MAG: putative dehydrogenase [Chloroflexi bacterium]|nr:putative dehydrogenase [Chloroflexota bacterium]
MKDHLRWGVLGAANIACAQVIPAIQASRNGTVVALASRDEQKGKAAATDLGIDRLYTSYEALLADPEVDAIYNPLPISMHVEWIIRAANAGKAVLCEKALTATASEAERAVETCARLGVPLMEAFMYRFHPQNVRVRELLAEGVIGEVREVRAGLCVRLMDPPDPGNVRLQPALAGGTLLDMGCYTVNTARMIFGEEPLRVLAWRDFDRQFGVDVSLTGILEFSDRRVASISCSFRTGDNHGYTIVGSKGVIEVPRAYIPGYGPRATETLAIISDENNNRREEHFPAANQYRLQAEAFAAAVLAGEPVPYPPEDSIRNMRVLDALARSAARDQAEAVR